MSSRLSRLNLAKARILVVDDSAPAMELLSQVLLGFGVTQASKHLSARSAHAVLAAKPFDLILADQEMPEESGLDLCRHVRGNPSGRNYTTAFILLSALPSVETVRLARDAGANYVLTKPIVPSVLLERIEWIAREERPFITSDGYRGPDRRFQSGPPPEGIGERRAEHLSLFQAPERALSQDEVNALFD